MSANESSHTAEPHEGPIKTPKQLIWAVVLSFVVPIIVIVLLVNYVTADKKTPAGSDAFEAEALAARIQPVARVSLKEAGAVGVIRTGQEVYAAACTACHAAGVAGAPKSGDATAWAARIKTGYDALLTSALKGKGAMPAQGGGQFSDYEVGRAVVYMVNAAGGKMDEPKAPAGAAPAAAAPAAAAAPQPAAAAAPEATATAATAAPAAVVAAAPAAGAGASVTPPALYTQACTVCHAAGVAGAPKTGDKAAWAPRIALGIDALTASTIKGKGAMPARGGSQASDADIRAVVTFMVNSAK
jgi:cytochrome c5